MRKNENTVPVQLRIDKYIFEKIKKIAREKSFKDNKDTKWQDIVRNIIYTNIKDYRYCKNEDKNEK